MPSYDLYRLRERAAAAICLTCTLVVFGMFTLSGPMPFGLRASGLVLGLFMLFLLARQHSEERQEQRALEKYRAALWRWKTTPRRSVR